MGMAAQGAAHGAALLLALLPHVCACAVKPPSKVVVLGPGDWAMQLITSKLTLSSGYGVSHFTNDDASITRKLKLMHGPTWDESKFGTVEMATSSGAMGAALSRADGCILIAEAGGQTGIANTLRFAPRLRRLVLLSAIGGARGIGGTAPADAPAIAAMEREVTEEAEAVGVELAIVRVGVLKGGGPVAGATDGVLGLDPSYYETFRIGGYPTPSRQTAMTYDMQTLGAAVTAGDTLTPRSPAARSLTKTKVEPFEDEISRTNAASALLACLRHEGQAPPDVSLSARSATVPPDEGEWDRMVASAMA